MAENGSQKLTPPSSSVILAVEGEDEVKLIEQLKRIHNWHDKEVEAFNFSEGERKKDTGSVAKRKLRRWLERTFSQRGVGVRFLGIICDAEPDRKTAESNLLDDLKAVGFPVAGGTKALSEMDAVGLRTAYLLLPDGAPAGALEHALVDACLLPTVKQAAEEYQNKVDQPERTDAWRKKVVVHSMIAAGKKPALTLGQSFDRSAHDVPLWDLNAPSIRVVKEFVEMLRGAA